MAFWHHMESEILASIGSVNGLLPDCIKRPSHYLNQYFNLSSVRSSDNRVRSISQKISQPSVVRRDPKHMPPCIRRIDALWTSNGKKGSVKWRCEHAQSRGFLGNFVNLHNATSQSGSSRWYACECPGNSNYLSVSSGVISPLYEDWQLFLWHHVPSSGHFPSL